MRHLCVESLQKSQRTSLYKEQFKIIQRLRRKKVKVQRLLDVGNARALGKLRSVSNQDREPPALPLGRPQGRRAAGPQKRAEGERARHTAGQQLCFDPTSNLLLYLRYRQSPFHAQSEEQGRSPGYRDRRTARPAREHFPPSFVLLSSSRDLSMWLRPTPGRGGRVEKC